MTPFNYGNRSVRGDTISGWLKTQMLSKTNRVYGGLGRETQQGHADHIKKNMWALRDEVDPVYVPSFQLMESTDQGETQNTMGDEMTKDLQQDDTEVQNLKARLQGHNTSPPKRRCRGSAKGTEFEKLRRIGRIPIRIKDNARGASCDYSHIFAERCTYIVKHFANLGHKSWMHVPKEDKEELYARVVGDFVLDWTRLEDQECVKHQMHEAFKSYKYKLHRIYKKFKTSEIARTNPPDEVDIETWLKLCTQWEDDDYKALCKKNATNRSKLVINHTAGSKSLHRLREEKRDEDDTVIEFYKRAHTHKDGSWVDEKAKNFYLKMVELQNERDPTKKDEGIAEEIVAEVLGQRSGYVRGMGKSVIPPLLSASRSSKFLHLTRQVESYKSEVDYYKKAYNDLTSNVEVLNQRCKDYEDKCQEYEFKLQYLYELLAGQSQPDGNTP